MIKDSEDQNSIENRLMAEKAKVKTLQQEISVTKAEIVCRDQRIEKLLQSSGPGPRGTTDSLHSLEKEVKSLKDQLAAEVAKSHAQYVRFYDGQALCLASIDDFKNQIVQKDKIIHELSKQVADSLHGGTGGRTTSQSQMASDEGQDYSKSSFTKGIDLAGQLERHYGNHRSGWGYAVASLAAAQDNEGIYLDTFVERTFCWNPAKAKPILKPWVGIIHVPPNVPDWFQKSQSNSTLFELPKWKESLPFCRGLFTLSDYHRDNLQKIFSFPVESLVHPTIIPEKRWSWEAFSQNSDKKIIQIGWWLRRLNGIFMLPESQYRKIFLEISKLPYIKNLLVAEREKLRQAGEYKDSMEATVDVVGYLKDDDYDNWLSENIGFIDLYDSSANNAVIECIARATPLLVNKLPPVVEYLGEDYPFYYDSYDEAIRKASDMEVVKATHEYLVALPKASQLTGNHFLNTLLNSEILKNIYTGDAHV